MGTRFMLVVDGGSVLGGIVPRIAAQVGLEATIVHGVESALDLLRARPMPVLLGADLPGARELVARLRGDREVADVAIAALLDRTGDEDLCRAYSWGVDEVQVPGGADDLHDLVQALSVPSTGERLCPPRGTVLVAFAAAGERSMRAAPFARMGYNVLFAASGQELSAALARDDLQLVLAGAGIADAASVPALLALDDRHRPWVVVAAGPLPPVPAGSRIALVGPDAAPADAIFVANELLRQGIRECRASARLLHATGVTFRPAGDAPAQRGLTWNVSREGLYVRTALPPAAGTETWIELRAPGGDAFVHLEATVAWTRPFGAKAGANAPPGFGARITGGSRRCLAEWDAGYARLLERHQGPAVVN